MKAKKKRNQTEVIITMIHLFLVQRSIIITWLIICLKGTDAVFVGVSAAAAAIVDAAAGAAVIFTT